MGSNAGGSRGHHGFAEESEDFFEEDYYVVKSTVCNADDCCCHGVVETAVETAHVDAYSEPYSLAHSSTGGAASVPLNTKTRLHRTMCGQAHFQVHDDQSKGFAGGARIVPGQHHWEPHFEELLEPGAAQTEDEKKVESSHKNAGEAKKEPRCTPQQVTYNQEALDRAPFTLQLHFLPKVSSCWAGGRKASLTGLSPQSRPSW